MTRTEYAVSLWQWTGKKYEFVDSAMAYAHNSGVRKSEELARTYARKLGTLFHGQRPNRDAQKYWRLWDSTAGDIQVMTRVGKVEK